MYVYLVFLWYIPLQQTTFALRYIYKLSRSLDFCLLQQRSFQS